MAKTKADLENDIRKMKEVIAGFKEPVGRRETEYQEIARGLLARAEGWLELMNRGTPTRIEGKYYPYGIQSTLISRN